MITIDQESKKRLRHPLDIDNMSERYKTENGLFVFTSPSFWTLQKNYFYLLKNSKKVQFEQKYKYRPDYLSFDEYQTVILAPVLMYVNSIVSYEDFDLSEVIIPTLNSIIEVSRDKFPKKETSDLQSVLW